MAIVHTPKARVIVGVDTGGTFTDVTLLDPATGRSGRQDALHAGRSVARFRQRHRRGAPEPPVAGADVARVLHGTTIATNLILEARARRRR